MVTVVSVSDAKVSSDAGDTLATYSLGSCIGVALWDPTAHVGGMLHFQLPTSTLDARRASECPLMFADTGMDWLMRSMEGLGAVRRRLRVKLAGAAQILNDAGTFNIGRRNHAAIRKIFWQCGMLIDAEDIGGSTPRHLYLRIGDGIVTVKKSDTVLEL